ncbi:hypothetical protein PILCRDRAFT_447102 [Piloderma croceum F 1598]|uniref:Uncharacterized protein n=1 Tax=Piloderma croceum (strain F 1598) TaxID=765440 RepID=A0A0C3FER7_PILCF|nr:hypothetical protein PILCRDRAFT_447102 [Piloderma croceum F 1598]
MPSTPPRVISNSPPDDANLSPAESLEKVQKFLKEKNGQALSEWETRGLLTFLEKNVQSTSNVIGIAGVMLTYVLPDDNEKPEPFRFSSTPIRTPARGNSPVFVFGSQGASLGIDGEGTTPRKTLSKNPNGVYRWQGAGSARPRNRYQSPSFGTRSPPPTIKLSPKTDIKRRRVGEDTTDNSASQTVPFPAVSPQKPANVSTSTPAPSQTRPSIFPPANSTDAAPNGASSSKTNGTTAPRLRTSGLPTKPTAPSVPSPLRQTWGQSDSPPHTPASRPNSTPTKAANFMTELIKDVTPPKRPDVSNPYQTASPVKPPAKKPVVKKPRASAKSPAPPPALATTPEPSPQAIIEATLPKVHRYFYYVIIECL